MEARPFQSYFTASQPGFPGLSEMAPLVEPHPPSLPPQSRSAPQELRHATPGLRKSLGEEWPRGFAPRSAAAPARGRGARPARSLRPSAHTQGAPEGVKGRAGRKTRRPRCPPGRSARARRLAVRRRCSCRTGSSSVRWARRFSAAFSGINLPASFKVAGSLARLLGAVGTAVLHGAGAVPEVVLRSNDSSAIVCPSRPTRRGVVAEAVSPGRGDNFPLQALPLPDGRIAVGAGQGDGAPKAGRPGLGMVGESLQQTGTPGRIVPDQASRTQAGTTT